MLRELNLYFAILYILMSFLTFYIEIVKWRHRKRVGGKEIWYKEWNIRSVAFPIWAAVMCYLLTLADLDSLTADCMETTLVLGFIYGSLYVFFNLRRELSRTW